MDKNRRSKKCENCHEVFYNPYGVGIKQWISRKYCSKKCSSKVTVKGRISWNKGLKGYLSGSKRWNWKGGITSRDKNERNKFRQTIQKQVFERDNYTCQFCGIRGTDLQVDHIQSWAEYVDLRFSMDNCRTLCMDCHYFVTFGRTKPKDIVWGHNFKKYDRQNKKI